MRRRTGVGSLTVSTLLCLLIAVAMLAWPERARATIGTVYRFLSEAIGWLDSRLVG